MYAGRYLIRNERAIHNEEFDFQHTNIV